MAASAPPSSDAEKLCDAILRHPGVKEGDRIITLDGGVDWPTLGSPVLFLRHFYDAFYTGVLGSCGGSKDDKGKRIRKVVVCGTPGIGKSAFGMYALFRALRDGHTVVYDSGRLEVGFVFYPSGDVVHFKHADRGDLAGLLVDPRTVHISDSIVPADNNAFTLLVTSPRRAVFHEFAKSVDCLPPCYFPTYTVDELLELAAVAFADELRDDEAGIHERFDRWGGVPRYVLGKSAAIYQPDLDRALTESAISAKTLRQAFASSDAVPDLAHHLLHLRSRGERDASLSPSSPYYYELAGAAFGSRYRYIKERVEKKLA